MRIHNHDQVTVSWDSSGGIAKYFLFHQLSISTSGEHVGYVARGAMAWFAELNDEGTQIGVTGALNPLHFFPILDRHFSSSRTPTMKRLLVFLPLIILLEGCVQTIAIRSMSGIMDYGFQAFNEESDLQIARESLGGNLKLLEALIKGDPGNEQFLLFAAQGYNAYGLAFAEDDSVERARVFYLRAKEFGLRILRNNKKFRESLSSDEAAFRLALQSFGKDDVPAIFWTASSWFSYINISRSEISALADISKAAAMMEFVLQKDSSYYYGGAYLFLGAIEGTTPSMLGGKPEKAKEYFEKCLSISNGNFLLAKLFYAKTYAVQVQDLPLFESLLKQIEEASLDALPDVRLANAVAKQKAKRLSGRTNDLF